jgi:type II pantothenate kinase
MGIDSLAAHEVIREVLLGAPYTGQFPSLPVTQQQENVSTIYLQVTTLLNYNIICQCQPQQFLSLIMVLLLACASFRENIVLSKGK